MKKKTGKICLCLCALVFAMFCCMDVQAKEDGKIKTGIYADSVDLSGMTKTEADEAIQDYVEKLGEVEITLLAADNQEVVTTAKQMGIAWSNPEIVEEALNLGIHGNVIERYKALKDLEHENYVFKIELQYDIEAIDSLLTEQCAIYDREAINYGLQREGDTFVVLEGQHGFALDVEASIDIVNAYLEEKWNQKPATIALQVNVTEPKGSVEQLQEVQDLLGAFQTSYTTSGKARSANVQNGCSLVNGTVLYPGDEFSTYQTVSPFSETNGYYMAGSYINGKVVDSLGGGICQVSTTLYNAVLLAELDVTERHNHSMIVTYVAPSADAAIAESAGKDFKFVNSSEYPIYIEGYTKNKHIYFNIYGKETRDEKRKVRYESEVLEETVPPSDNIYADPSRPIGYIVTESAHIGKKAKLWKVVTQNGKEISRELVNSSKYKMSPASATVGVATGDPNAYNEIMAAIGTYSIAHVKNVIAILTAPAPQ